MENFMYAPQIWVSDFVQNYVLLRGEQESILEVEIFYFGVNLERLCFYYFVICCIFFFNQNFWSFAFVDNIFRVFDVFLIAPMLRFSNILHRFELSHVIGDVLFQTWLVLNITFNRFLLPENSFLDVVGGLEDMLKAHIFNRGLYCLLVAILSTSTCQLILMISHRVITLIIKHLERQVVLIL